MSHTRVKTVFETEGAYGSTEYAVLYCHHNHSNDTVSFYFENGELATMCFHDWTFNNLWEAMHRLSEPFKGDWGKELKDGVEYYKEIGD